MGLDTTHDCWHGPYSSFGRWREWVAAQVGIPLKQMAGFTIDGISWECMRADPLHILLSHSDCDGKLRWFDCKAIALRLLEIYRRTKDTDTCEPQSMRWATLRFALGCMRAYRARENVGFH